MKKLFLLVAALFVIGTLLPVDVLAQNNEDVIYLKNGSVIRGMIVEQVPNVSLKIETRDGSIFVYQMDEIEKMTKEMPRADNQAAGDVRHSSESQSIKQTAFHKPKGYMGILDFGGGYGFGRYAAHRASISIINGYRIAPQFAVGIGVGAEMFFYHWTDGRYDYDGPEYSLPVFLHLRSDFVSGKVSPYVAFNVGYNVSLSGGFIGGIMLEPSAGVSFNVGSKNRMMFGLAYTLDRVKYGYDGYVITGMAGALKLKIGFSF